MNSDSPLLNDMQMTMANADGDWEAKNQKVTELVEKTFPKGTDLNSALMELQKQGFEINEYKPEGWRVWPKGTIQQYPSENKTHKFSVGEITYTAEMKYGLPLDRYGAVVSLRTDGKQIIGISAGIYPYHL